MTELPDYADLPLAPGGGHSAWGLFGVEDNLGLVNLMTPQRIAAAARLVRRDRSSAWICRSAASPRPWRRSAGRPATGCCTSQVPSASTTLRQLTAQSGQ